MKARPKVEKRDLTGTDSDFYVGKSEVLVTRRYQPTLGLSRFECTRCGGGSCIHVRAVLKHIGRIMGRD